MKRIAEVLFFSNSSTHQHTRDKKFSAHFANMFLFLSVSDAFHTDQ